MSLLAELKRRNVFRVAVFYIVTAWLVIQVAETLLPVFQIPDWVIRAVVFLFVIGFVPAMLFSWLYEITPEGIKREEDVVRDDSITHLTAKRLDVFTIAVVILGVGFVVLDRFVLEPDVALPAADQPQAAAPPSTETRAAAETPGVKTVAVLPFVNMSSDAENEYFSDGISEEILNVLVQIKGLQVSSRTSAFSFKGKDVDIPTVAAALKVRHVLEGSVRRAGDQVRITAQLIDVETDSHLWSDTYTRTMDDIFAIQDEIALAIAGALEVELLGNAGQEVATHSTENVDAFEQYLLGRYYFHQRTAESLPKAIELFKQVVEIDTEFAAAYSGLSDAYMLVWQYGDFDVQEAISLARAAAERAIELDPDLAEGYASAGLVASVAGERDRGFELYDRAIELNPGYSMTYVWKGNGLRIMGDIQGSLETFLAGERVDPLHPLYAENIGDSLIQMGRFEEAEARLKKGVEQHPDSWLVRNRLANAYLESGQLVEAHRQARKDARDFPDAPLVLNTLIDLELKLGRLESADYWIGHFRTELPQSLNLPFLLMQREMTAGNITGVMQAMEQQMTRVPPRFANGLRGAMAYMSLRIDDPAQALEHLEQFNPDEAPMDQQIDAMVYRAYAHAMLDQSEAAVDVAQDALEALNHARNLGNRQHQMLLAEAVMLAVAGRIEESEQVVEVVHQAGNRLDRPNDLRYLLDRLLVDSERYAVVRREAREDVARQLALIEQELEG